MKDAVYLAEENFIKAVKCVGDATVSLAKILDKAHDPVVLDETDSTEEAAKTD